MRSIEANSAKRTKKVFLLDNVIIGSNHLIINSAMVKVLGDIYQEEDTEVTFFGEQEHITSVFSIVKTNFDRLQLQPIKVIKPAQGRITKITTWLQKLATDVITLKRVVRNADFQGVDLIVFTTLIPLNLLRFVLKLGDFNQLKFLFLLHGEVEYIFRKDISKSQRLKGFLLAKALKLSTDSMKFVVFGDYTKDSLLKHKLLPASRIISINHPILEFERTECVINECVIFSHLGVGNRRKNSSLIFELANSMRDYIAAGKVHFSLIGRMIREEVPCASPYVSIESSDDKPLNNERYRELIERTNYSLYFVNDDEYIFRASGSLLDSVQYQVPIIALEHQSTKELFEKGGDIGFLCKDRNEMESIIRKIAEKDLFYISRYQDQVKNMKNLAFKFSVKYATQVMEKSIRKWN